MQLKELESLEVFAAGAANSIEPKYTASYIDTYFQSGKKIPGSSGGVFVGATDVTAVTAPDADFVSREITGFTIYNADDVASTVTVQKDVNGTEYPIIKAILPAGYSLVYNGTGWAVSPFEASASDSKATSNSVVISTNLSTGDSKAASNSVLISTADSKAVSNSITTSTADSKAVSAGTAASVADSKALSVSVLTSTADSKAVSNSVIGSTNLSTGDSKSLSQSILISSNASAILSAHP